MSNQIRITLLSAIVIFLGVVFGLLFWNGSNAPQQSYSATGGAFNVQSEYLTASTTVNLNPSVTSTFVATTSPVYIVANATTTFTVVTAGVSDLRLNLEAKSTTTAIDIAIKRYSESQQGIYPSSDLAATGILTDTPLISWKEATTTDATLKDGGNPKKSIHFTNINTPKLQFNLGTSAAVDLSLEFVKIFPN